MHNLDFKHCKTKSLYAEYYLVDGYSYCKEFANSLKSNVQKRIDILNQKKRLIRELYFSVPMFVIMSIIFMVIISGLMEVISGGECIALIIGIIFELFFFSLMRVGKWIKAYVDSNGSKDPLYITYVVGMVLTATLINIPIGLCMMISDIVEICRINKNLKMLNTLDCKCEQSIAVGGNTATIECMQANQLLQMNTHHTFKEVAMSVIITLLILTITVISAVVSH